MDLPSHIGVGGKRIRLKIRALEDGSYGQFDSERMEITIDPKTAADDRVLRDTLRHELLHASFHVSGHSFAEKFDEEPIVRMLENIFFPAMENLESRMFRKIKQPCEKS